MNIDTTGDQAHSADDQLDEPATNGDVDYTSPATIGEVNAAEQNLWAIGAWVVASVLVTAGNLSTGAASQVPFYVGAVFLGWFAVALVSPNHAHVAWNDTLGRIGALEIDKTAKEYRELGDPR